MQPAKTILYYVHDPMCSWCWGFRPTWLKVQKALPENVSVVSLLGGLAADTSQPMPDEMQQKISAIWRTIQQQIPATTFNFDFWIQNTPKRSTYPACRAIIAARQQNPSLEQAMILAIQQAYYLKAMNPSESKILVQLADKLGLDTDLFARDLVSEQTQQILLDEIHMAKSLGVQGFPSLVLANKGDYSMTNIDYTQPDVILQQINTLAYLD